MAILNDDFSGTWQTIYGCTIHYNQSEARLYRGIHQAVVDVIDGEERTRLSGEHLEYVGSFPTLQAAQDAAL